MRPYGFFGKPLFASGVISVHVSPPSVERNRPLAEGAVGLSPPERYSQPLRRKSHMAANTTSRFAGISRPVKTAIRRITPKRARDSHENRVAVLWAHHNLCNALGVFQTGTCPGFAAIG